MIALLSWAWWAQKLGSVTAQAIAAAAAVAILIGAITAGIVWLRADARADEAARWEARLANARMQAYAVQRTRVRRSEEIGAQHRALLAIELQAANQRVGELETALGTRPRTVCYPKDIARRLNR